MTDILTRLENLADSLPEGSSVTFTDKQLREWLHRERTQQQEDDGIRPDLKISEVAEMLGRSTPTIRRWIKEGALEGYRMQNRELRITRESVKAFYEKQRAEDAAQ